MHLEPAVGVLGLGLVADLEAQPGAVDGAAHVAQGLALLEHLALEQAKVLDPLAVEMVRVGEQSSALPEMLDHVADFFDQEVEKATTAVTSLIGPVLILFMGVVVMGLLLAIYVPLFNASSVVR